jgi:hypothetical protein
MLSGADTLIPREIFSGQAAKTGVALCNYTFCVTEYQMERMAGVSFIRPAYLIVLKVCPRIQLDPTQIRSMRKLRD